MLFSQLATMMLPEDENFLLLFRRETPLDNSVEFMRVRVRFVPHVSEDFTCLHQTRTSSCTQTQHELSVIAPPTGQKLHLH